MIVITDPIALFLPFSFSAEHKLRRVVTRAILCNTLHLLSNHCIVAVTSDICRGNTIGLHQIKNRWRSVRISVDYYQNRSPTIRTCIPVERYLLTRAQRRLLKTARRPLDHAIFETLIRVFFIDSHREFESFCIVLDSTQPYRLAIISHEITALYAYILVTEPLIVCRKPLQSYERLHDDDRHIAYDTLVDFVATV